MSKTIFITEEQAKLINEALNQTFSIDTLKSTNWKNGEEIIRYCEQCNMYQNGAGVGRTVFQIDDEKVIKIQKSNTDTPDQNLSEVKAFQKCDNKMKEFVPYIYDYDRNNKNPLWIISEQVLTATYADFQKILGIDFGSYNGEHNIRQMKRDLEDYSKYDGKTVNKFSVNLMDFLDAYGDGDLDMYSFAIKKNPWLQELVNILDKGIAFYWELEIIENWGLVTRNGQPKLIILDSGI